jgi:hypothetical protein
VLLSSSGDGEHIEMVVQYVVTCVGGHVEMEVVVVVNIVTCLEPVGTAGVEDERGDDSDEVKSHGVSGVTTIN